MEYRIVELAEGGFWYGHGYQGFSAEKAEESLHHLQKRYGAYGRVFRMETRQVGPWGTDKS